MTSNPRMHTGIFTQSPYAYGDQANPRMHMGIALELCVQRGLMVVSTAAARVEGDTGEGGKGAIAAAADDRHREEVVAK